MDKKSCLRKDFQKKLLAGIKFIDIPRQYSKSYVSFDKWKEWWDKSCEVKYRRKWPIIIIDEVNYSD